MSTPARHARFAALASRLGLPVAGFAMLVGASAGCVGDANPGIDPPADALFFPSGLLLDPRRGPDQRASYLLVTNGNNDLSYNAGTVTVIDLDRFYEAWADDELGVYPYCEDAPTQGRTRRRCVLDRGSVTTDELPCRRLALTPQVVECDEAPFAVDSVRLGDFATVIEASTHEPDGVPRAWVPVRGGPSITYIDVADGRPRFPGVPGDALPTDVVLTAPDLRCGQGRRNGEYRDDARCDDEHRLTHLRDDDELPPLDREPFNIYIDESIPDGQTAPAYRYAYVAHSAGATLTLIDLDGLGDRDPGSVAPTKPVIVDAQPVFFPASPTATTGPGGFGLASRPCSTADLDGDGQPDNAASLTLHCSRPLVYGSFRFAFNMTSFTTGEIDGLPLPSADLELEDCFEPDGSPRGPYCAGPEDLGKPCTIVCDPHIVAARQFIPGGVDRFAPTATATYGDIAFADDAGETLYVVQTNPGALLQIDTSLDLDNEPFDIPGAPPIELCDRPTRMRISKPRGLAFVSCFRAAEVFVVDLRAHRVVETVLTGTGPHDLAVDEVAQKLYVTNSLEGSVSVIELDRGRPDYLRELARIGLQEPFSQ